MKLASEKPQQPWSFHFANKGDEIPAAAQSHIFDKFYQADTSHATQGNGLGLAIVHKIIGLHGGTVKVRRSDLTGTIMDVTLSAKMTKMPRKNQGVFALNVNLVRAVISV